MTETPRKQTANGGFTLLEILVATIISGFVALTAVASLQAVIRSRDKIDASIETAAELNFAVRMISDDLRNIARDSGDDGCNLVGVLMPLEDMASANLTVQAVRRGKARSDQPESDVYEVEYYLVTDEAKSQLMRRVWPYPDDQDEPAGILSAIADNVTAFDITYYDGVSWESEWPEDMTQLPHLVKVTLAAQGPEQKQAIRRSVLLSFPRRPGRTIEPSADIDATEENDEDSENESDDNEEQE